ncbi:MAG: hypothetical protein AAFQ82_10995 [Myxococcota bacterium]
MNRISILSLSTALFLSSACTTTRRFSVPKPASARGDAIVLTDKAGNEHVVKEGRLKTEDELLHEVPAYLMIPEHERAAIRAVAYEDSSCGVRGGAIAAAVSVGAGLLWGLGADDEWVGRKGMILVGGATGLLLSPLSALIGSGLAKSHCAQVRPVTVR